MLPLSGLLIALFVGYAMKKELIDAQMQGTSPRVMKLWQVTLRYIAPVAISAVFVMGIVDKFFS